MNTIESKLDRIIEILEIAFPASQKETPAWPQVYDASQSRAVLQFCLRSGVRVAELLDMRPCDIYREGDKFPEGYFFPSLNGCWVYIPPRQPDEGPRRFIILDKACQDLLAPYLDSAESDDSSVFPKP